MKMKAYESFDAYLRDQSAAHQRIIRALRKLVARVQPRLVESVKYGNGCWIGESGPVAYVYSDKDHVQFGFLQGSSLRDPKGLLEGEARYVRHIKVRRTSEIDERAFTALLRQASAATSGARKVTHSRKGDPGGSAKRR